VTSEVESLEHVKFLLAHGLLAVHDEQCPLDAGPLLFLGAVPTAAFDQRPNHSFHEWFLVIENVGLEHEAELRAQGIFVVDVEDLAQARRVLGL